MVKALIMMHRARSRPGVAGARALHFRLSSLYAFVIITLQKRHLYSILEPSLKLQV